MAIPCHTLWTSPSSLPKTKAQSSDHFSLCTWAKISRPSHNVKYDLYTDYLTFTPLRSLPAHLTKCPTHCLTRMSERHLKLNGAQTQLLTYLTPLHFCFRMSLPHFHEWSQHPSVCLGRVPRRYPCLLLLLPFPRPVHHELSAH